MELFRCGPPGRRPTQASMEVPQMGSVHLGKAREKEVSEDGHPFRISQFLGINKENIDLRSLKVGQYMHQIRVFVDHIIRQCADTHAGSNRQQHRMNRIHLE